MSRSPPRRPLTPIAGGNPVHDRWVAGVANRGGNLRRSLLAPSPICSTPPHLRNAPAQGPSVAPPTHRSTSHALTMEGPAGGGIFINIRGFSSPPLAGPYET